MWSHIAVGCSISIHAPAKGATVIKPKSMPKKELFQSTLPRRERQFRDTWHTRLKYFNPRSREGSDVVYLVRVTVLSIFQSTLPRRERRNGQKKEMEPIHISIHAPAKGATHSVRVYVFRVHISIHAPAKGAT